MTRTSEISFPVYECEIDNVVERTTLTRTTSIGSFLSLFLLECGAIALVALITIGILAAL